jgi:catechol 2,3-dioxygenase-like lactoylglutathione lyase family enzyme
MSTPGLPEAAQMELFHTGMIVQDLQSAIELYTLAFGMRFAEPLVTSGLMLTNDGLRNRTSWVTYSLDGPHRVELIEQADDAAWQTARGGPQVHHLGFWVDDLAGETERLEGLGFTFEVGGRDAHGDLAGVVYLANEVGGLLIELVDRVTAAQLVPYFEGRGPGAYSAHLERLGLSLEELPEAFATRRSATRSWTAPTAGGPAADADASPAPVES